MYQIVVAQRIEPFLRDVIFVIWSRQCVSVKLRMFLLAARRAELEVRRVDDKMKSTSIDQTRCGLLRHPFLRLLVETSPNFPDGLH